MCGGHFGKIYVLYLWYVAVNVTFGLIIKSDAQILFLSRDMFMHVFVLCAQNKSFALDDCGRIFVSRTENKREKKIN